MENGCQCDNQELFASLSKIEQTLEDMNNGQAQLGGMIVIPVNEEHKKKWMDIRESITNKLFWYCQELKRLDRPLTSDEDLVLQKLLCIYNRCKAYFTLWIYKMKEDCIRPLATID